jgi:hypothetical protein
MRELQESQPKSSIRERNRLEASRRDRLEHFRRLHAKRKEEVDRVASQTARHIIADFKRRDTLGGVPDEQEVLSLIDLRDRLRTAIGARNDADNLLIAIQNEYREASRTSAQGCAKLQEISTRGEAALAGHIRWRHEVVVLEREFEDRTTEAGCMPALYTTHLEEDLGRARSGKRRAEPEFWDISQQICRHFVTHITARGIAKNRVSLDEPDDALAYTLVVRALLSGDPKENLLAVAISEQEDEWLVARRGPASWVRGLPLHEFVALTLWPRREEQAHDQLPLPPEVLRERGIEAKDERLRWFLLAAEQALEAVTGIPVPDVPGNAADVVGPGVAAEHVREPWAAAVPSSTTEVEPTSGAAIAAKSTAGPMPVSQLGVAPDVLDELEPDVATIVRLFERWLSGIAASARARETAAAAEQTSTRQGAGSESGTANTGDPVTEPPAAAALSGALPGAAAQASSGAGDVPAADSPPTSDVPLPLGRGSRLTPAQLRVHNVYRAVVELRPELEGRPESVFDWLLDHGRDLEVRVIEDERVKWIRGLHRARKKMGETRSRRRASRAGSRSVIERDEV